MLRPLPEDPLSLFAPKDLNVASDRSWKVYDYFGREYHNLLKRKCSSPSIFFFFLPLKFKKGGGLTSSTHVSLEASRGVAASILLNIIQFLWEIDKISQIK